MDPDDVNPKLAIFLPTPSPIKKQGMDDIAPLEKKSHIPLIFRRLLFIHQNNSLENKLYMENLKASTGELSWENPSHAFS